MDPLSVTASVIAITTATLQSAKALSNAIDGLVDAPRAISQTKSLLSQTETTLGMLTKTLEANSATGAVDLVLKEIELDRALEYTATFCGVFMATVTRLTAHSTDTQFSRRDRCAIYFKESKLNKLNKDLAGCQRTISMVLSSIILYEHASVNEVLY